MNSGGMGWGWGCCWGGGVGVSVVVGVGGAGCPSTWLLSLSSPSSSIWRWYGSVDDSGPCVAVVVVGADDGVARTTELDNLVILSIRP